MHLQKRPHHAILFYSLAAVLGCGLLLWGLCAPKSITLNSKTSFPNINEGWSLLQDGAQITLDTVCQYEYAQETITITRTLPDYTNTQYLLFYTEHQTVSVTIEGAEIYCYEIPSGFAFLQTPGNTWHSIALSPDYAGQSISITFSCPFSLY